MLCMSLSTSFSCFLCLCFFSFFFFFKQKTAYDMRISDWISDVCSSDLPRYFARTDHKYVTHVNERMSDLFARNIEALDASSVESLVRSLVRLVEQIGRASCRERVCQYV